MSPRRTRQHVKQSRLSISSTSKSAAESENHDAKTSRHSKLPTAPEVEHLPVDLDMKSTDLKNRDLSLLRRKQRWLTTFCVELPTESTELKKAADATLVFAQEEAGTAVCVSPSGFLLTCSHCVAESADEFDHLKNHWLLFASGRVVRARCVAWDPKRDLALLQITAARTVSSATGTSGESGTASFPYISIATSPPKFRARLLCIGHPGSEDLEAAVPGIKTNYDVLHASTGVFRGHAKGQDLQDNSEIGALQHDCWTYWGHSGAPLVHEASGMLVGLHSSWDDQTAMRRGIPLEAMQQFLKEHDSIFTV
jgi:hypothetical protein